ncbi:MAG: polynucleotide adenylyltransferase PcnB, partial [Pseudomonadales bacterium]
NTDQRIAEGRPVTPGFLLAVLLWDDYQARISELTRNKKINEARLLAAHEALAKQRHVLAIPRRFSQFVNDVWQLQERLETRRARQIQRTLSHPRFRAAYDFLLLRSLAGLFETRIADWWTEIQETDSTQREQMIAELAPEPRRKRRRRRQRRQS